MKAQVKLSAIIEGIEFAAWGGLDEHHAFLDTRSGEVLLIPEDAFQEADQDDSEESETEWMHELAGLARAILDDDSAKRKRYLGLPNAFDLNEYRLMEKFALSQEGEHVGDDLYRSLRGKGAFRMFKIVLHRHGLTDAWHRRRDEALKEIAVAWCRENKIKFIKEE